MTDQYLLNECHELLTEAGVAGHGDGSLLPDRIRWALQSHRVPDRSVAMAMTELDKAGVPKNVLEERVAWLLRRLEEVRLLLDEDRVRQEVDFVLDPHPPPPLPPDPDLRLSNLEKRVAGLERRRCDQLDMEDSAKESTKTWWNTIDRYVTACGGTPMDNILDNADAQSLAWLISGVVKEDADEADSNKEAETEDYDHSDDRSVEVLNIAENAVKAGRCSRIKVNGSWRYIGSMKDVDAFRGWVKRGSMVSEYRYMEPEDKSLKALDIAKQVLEVPNARAQIRIATISGGAGFWEMIESKEEIEKIRGRVSLGARISECKFDCYQEHG